jgi:GT2 family glycosyltransferase
MITIFTISYNSAAVIEQCMDSLMRSQGYRIIVVDNASRDGSAGKIRETYPHVEIIELSQNIGYGRAANVALKQVSTPYALLINPDLLVSAEDISALLEIAEKHKEAALIGPAVKKQDHLKQGMLEREWISGSAMLFNMEQFTETGFFDEQIFLFYEETDLCKRLISSGKKVYLCSDLFIEHLKGQSCAPNPAVEYMKSWHMGWSLMHYLKKHGLDSGRKSSWRLLLNYAFKAVFSTNADKRLKSKARFLGSRAYLNGQEAFLADGTPQMSPASQENPFCKQ